VSSTLGKPRWGNGTVLKGDVVTEVAKLRRELDGDIVVNGSTRLVHRLMEHDLVDELRLTVYPVVLGAGERLFGETSDKKPLRLVRSRTLGDNLLFLRLGLHPPGASSPGGGRRLGQGGTPSWAATPPASSAAYGSAKLTEVPQLARPSLVPPQVACVTVNCGGWQLGNWMYSLAK